MIRTLVFYLLFYVSHATTCSQLKTLYSDLTCCSNLAADTCLRTIPLCASAENGEICTDTNDHAIIKGGVSATIPTASTTVLGGVMVDGTSIVIANGVISAPISSSSSSSAFSGDYDDLTNKPTIPTAFSGDYDDLTNKPTIVHFSGDYDDLTNKPTIVHFSGDYDDLTNKPTIPTAFSGDYDDLTNKPTASNVAVDDNTIKQHANGTIYVANAPSSSGSSSGGVQKNGQVLDLVAGVADGRTVKGAEGDYVLETVSAQQHISSTTVYDDVTGSKISYKPPAGTTEVIYKFRYHMKAVADTSSWEGQQLKLYVGGTPCGPRKHTDNHNYGDTWVEFEWIIQVGTDDMPNGKIASWDTLKEIKLGMIEDDLTRNAVIHGSASSGLNYDGNENDVVLPELEVRAIGLGQIGGGGATTGGSSGSVQKNGQLLDLVVGIADGRTVKGAEGDYTLQNVVALQDISSDTVYDDVTGSLVTYKPPEGTTDIIYKFRYSLKQGKDTSAWERNMAKLFVDGIQCGDPKKSHNLEWGDGWVEMEWIIQVGTDDMPNAKIASWDTLKTIKMQMKEESPTAQAQIHGSNYYANFEENTIVLQPEIEIRAIGLGQIGGGGSNVQVDNSTIKQHTNGTIYVATPSSTGVITREGQVLEELVGLCDGRTVGTYTWPDVTQTMETLSSSWVTLSGSEINYMPPTGATEVIYILNFLVSRTPNAYSVEYRFYIDGNLLTNVSPIQSKAHTHAYGILSSLRFAIKIGGTTDYANGVVSDWASAKTLKIDVFSSPNAYWGQVQFHKKVHTFSEATGDIAPTTSANDLVKPILNIRAIGVQLNYINFDPTPTALLSAQTFTVTRAECQSTALINSINAQWQIAYPDKTLGTGSFYDATESTLPNGCQFYNYDQDTVSNRIGYNTNTADPNDELGSGYDTASFTTRICKYANGDFVLLIDPTAKCKTVHFTLPDNLNALAGVLQVDGTKLGLGISPAAPFHVGTGTSTSISASRFECDGSGSIVEQTSGELATPMTHADCSTLPNFENGVVLPAVTATKHSDAYCKDVAQNSPYNFNVVELTTGNLAYTYVKAGYCTDYNVPGMYSSQHTGVTAAQCSTICIQAAYGDFFIHYSTYCYCGHSGDPAGCSSWTTDTSYNTYKMPGGHLSLEQCTHYVDTTAGETFGGSGDWNDEISGCIRDPNGNIYYNSNVNSLDCDNDGSSCIAKLNANEVTSGAPANSLTEGQCRAYATSNGLAYESVAVRSELLPIGSTHIIGSGYSSYGASSASTCATVCAQQGFSYSSYATNSVNCRCANSEGNPHSYGYGTGVYKIEPQPSGCYKEGSKIWHTSLTTSVDCSVAKSCIVEGSSSFENPGTTDQLRVNACRDACSDRSTALFSGSWDFRSASFWVEPKGGQCWCSSEPSATCLTESSTAVDLYSLHNPPPGCFKEVSTGIHYHNTPINDNFGVCSPTYTCLRNDQGCLVEDTATETKELSIISEKSAWFKQEVVISSDRRIKDNITDIVGARATMRQIPARRYGYVDKRKWNGTTVGFIAQEVKEVMPEAVKIERGFVPNLLKRVSCSFARNVTLKMTCAELASGRVRLFVTDKGGESLLDVAVKNGTMEVNKVYTQVYAFGYEVEDFHTLEKSKLFALNFAATKELDKEVQLLREEVNKIKQAVGI